MTSDIFNNVKDFKSKYNVNWNINQLFQPWMERKCFYTSLCTIDRENEVEKYARADFRIFMGKTPRNCPSIIWSIIHTKTLTDRARCKGIHLKDISIEQRRNASNYIWGHYKNICVPFMGGIIDWYFNSYFIHISFMICKKVRFLRSSENVENRRIL